MKSCIFTNDNNITISLIRHPFTIKFSKRDNHEVLFRRINTFLINNKIIQNNIIDLGAWIGDNSIPWSKNINGIVYAIDPSTNNCKYIKKICKVNNINNIKVIKTAISNKNEILTTNGNINHCSFVYKNIKNNEKLKISAVSLDYLYETKQIENIGYIHLDVEGMEYKILEGSNTIINKYRPIITFEQHLEIDDYNIILNYLNNKNYKVFLIDEILPGCRVDCRNSIAFPNEIFTDGLIIDINNYIGKNILIPK